MDARQEHMLALVGQEQRELDQAAEHRPLAEGPGWYEWPINLADTALDTLGQSRPVSGYGLLYRKIGSSPNGRLNLVAGRELVDFAPGAELIAPFRELQVVRSPRSGTIGIARLIVLTRPDVKYREPDVVPGSPRDPVYLLGSSSAYVAVPEDTQPAGAAPAGSFQIAGWKRLLVELDGGAANTLTTTDLIPWTRDPDSTLWQENGADLVNVPDSAATGYRYRSFILNVAGSGLMFLEIRNALPAGLTEIGMKVKGLE